MVSNSDTKRNGDNNDAGSGSDAHVAYPDAPPTVEAPSLHVLSSPSSAPAMLPVLTVRLVDASKMSDLIICTICHQIMIHPVLSHIASSYSFVGYTELIHSLSLEIG
jgi:hypothetical protein